MNHLISAVLSLSLTVLSFGPAVPAAAARIAAVRAVRVIPTAPVVPLGSLTHSLAPNLGLTNAPVLSHGLSTAPGITLRALSPAAVPSAVQFSPRASVAQQALSTPAGRPTDFAASLKALSRKTPEFAKMAAKESRDSAHEDFSARIGEGGGSVRADGEAVVEAAAPTYELIVSAAEGSGRQLTQDVYPEYLSAAGAAPVSDVRLQEQLMVFGVTRSLLAVHDAAALGTIAQINSAVIKVPGAKAGSLIEALHTLGLEVQVGRVFATPQPQQADPLARTVGLKEMGAVIGADKLQAELKKVLGEPAPPVQAKERRSIFTRLASWAKRTFLGVAAENPELPWAILDSFSFVDHPYLKGRFLKSVANKADGQTHGTHTAGTVVGVDIFNYAGRNYNIFPNGRASEGDILFKMNMAHKDGALASTHSWGDGSGNPEGAIEKLFTQTAADGMHHSISAGNACSRKNTIGGPAITYHKVDLLINGKTVGTVKRIKAIAASDADKKTAYFSSRGPASSTVARNPERYPNYPQKPDESGVGVNLVAPMPKGANVPELGGPGGKMSGTSMSNPGVFGGFMLLTRGILVLLKDRLPNLPGTEVTRFAMDLARYSMTQTAEKVAGADEVGDGFVNVWTAFQYAGQVLAENAPVTLTTRLRGLVRSLMGFAPTTPRR